MQPITQQLNRALYATIVVLLVAGCSGHLPTPSTSVGPAREAELLNEILGGPSDGVDPIDPLILNEDLKRYIDDHVDRKWSGKTKLEALRKLMFAVENLNIEYDASHTQTAIETFRSRRGNCLSMTNLFVAAARYVDVDARYQMVEVEPTWEKTGSTMIRNTHINAMGWISGHRKYVIDFLPEVTFNDRDSYTVTDLHAVALYYTNLGAESIIDGHPGTALRYLRTALAIKPELADAWNNMGAAMRRLARFEQAEFSFQQAVRLDSRHYTAMSNLGHFYRQQGNSRSAKRYLSMVKRYRARHPYHLFFKGRMAYERSDYRAALKYLKKAISKKRDDPEFYLALSNIYGQLGEQRRRDINVRKAAEYREKLKQYHDKQEMDLLIRGPSMSIIYKATRIPLY